MKALTPILQNVPNWETLMAEQAIHLGVPVADVLAALAAYDAWQVAGGKDFFQPYGHEGYDHERTYKNSGKGRPKTVPDHFEADPVDTVTMIAEHVMNRMRAKLTPAVGVVKPKRHRRTAEAIRKDKARAAGRVRPRAKKGPPSLTAQITAREASLTTRRTKLEALKADPGWYRAPGEVLRTEAGIAKTERAIVTLRARLKRTAESG